MKKFFITIALLGITFSAAAESRNLLLNPGFEEYKESHSPLFGDGLSFDNWYEANTSFILAEKEDVHGGDVAFRTKEKAFKMHLFQDVTDMADYPDGTEFEITVNYKIIAPAEAADSLISYWSSPRENEMSHDFTALHQPLENTISSEWKTLRVTTTKPNGATRFAFYMVISKGSVILVDDLAFSVQETPSAVNEVAEMPTARKQFVNGQLVIEHNGVKINAQGQVIY